MRGINCSLFYTSCFQTPLTDADEIRALACRALVGLARSSTATQIMSKLSIFNNGVRHLHQVLLLMTSKCMLSLQVLNMLLREPVLQDRRAEHVKFQKQAHELMERVSAVSELFECSYYSSLETSIHLF